MKKKTWLIVASLCVVIGCIVFGGVMVALRGDFSELATVEYETNEYEVKESYRNIEILTDTADVTFVASKNSASLVTCYERKNEKHSVTVKDDTLVIRLEDERNWYEHIGIGFGTPKITVTIPEGEYGTLSVNFDTSDVALPKGFQFEAAQIQGSTGDVTCSASIGEKLQVRTSTGDIRLENMSAGAMDLAVSTGHITASAVSCAEDIGVKVSTGKTELTDVICKNFTSTGSTGDVSLINTVAGGKFSVERSTGDVSFEGCDAAEIFVETSTGHVTGWLLSAKVFRTETDTGKIQVPMTISGGLCRIVTDTGDIKIDVRHS